ncbi:Cation transport regulator-like protein 2 [Boothiomyces sp. JEL0838]|nr:Cation transport regulator-like protein 2 [Boothiomyces sp. JEL0838]
MTWIFGYGSLIWKADFPYERKIAGYITGYVRRFWQGSTDHRGTEETPGRVVTLIKYEEWQSKYSEIDATITDDKVYGCLYKIADESKQAVFDHLDYREKGGYEMQTVKVYTNEGVIESYLYIADYHNDNYLGPSDLDSMAKQIGFTVGPSGNNSDYLLNLCKALREIGAEEDLHLMELEKRVMQLLNPSST